MSSALPINDANPRDISSVPAEGATSLAYNFPLLEGEDLVVEKTTPAGVTTELSAPQHFSISGVGSASGGSLALAQAANGEDAYRRYGLARIKRETDMTLAGAYNTRALEADLDRSRIIERELRRDLGMAEDSVTAERLARELRDLQLEALIQAFALFTAADQTLGGLTRSAIAAMTIPAGVTYLRTIGVDGPDVGPSEILHFVASAPAHGNFVTDLGGRIFAAGSRTQEFYTGGLDADEIHTAFIAKLEELEIKGGGILYVDDTITFTDQGFKGDFSDVSIFILGRYGRPTIKAAAGMIDPVLAIHAGTIGEGRLVFQNIRIDLSESNTAGRISSHLTGASGPSLHNWGDVLLLDYDVKGGAAFQDYHGDSGVSHVSVVRFTWIRGHVIYCTDIGGYFNGGNTPDAFGDDGKLTIVKDVLFEYCSNGLATKRELLRMAVDNCEFWYCGGGITTAETFGVAGVPNTKAGRNLVVNGCRFYFTSTQPITVKANDKALVQDCHIRDFGRTPAGAAQGIDSTIFCGIKILGASNGVYLNNLIEMVDWAPGAGVNPGGSMIGVRLEDYVLFPGEDDEATYTPAGNVFRGNTFRKLDRGIHEVNSGANFYPENFFGSDVVEPIHSTGFNAGSTASYHVQGTGGFQRLGNNIWRTDLLTGAKPLDPISLADGAGQTTTVTVNGAVLGDFVAGVSFSLDLQGIIVTAWVSDDDEVSLRLQNETTGTLDLASGTLRVLVRPKV